MQSKACTSHLSAKLRIENLHSTSKIHGVFVHNNLIKYKKYVEVSDSAEEGRRQLWKILANKIPPISVFLIDIGGDITPPPLSTGNRIIWRRQHV